MKLKDFLKENLAWKKDKPEMTDACVFLDLNQTPGNFEDPKLETDNCQQEKYFLCEVIFGFCRNESLLKITIRKRYGFQGLAKFLGNQKRASTRMSLFIWSVKK